MATAITTTEDILLIPKPKISMFQSTLSSDVCRFGLKFAFRTLLSFQLRGGKEQPAYDKKDNPEAFETTEFPYKVGETFFPHGTECKLAFAFQF